MPSRAGTVIAAHAAVGVALCFVPLFNLLGYESAAAIGLTSGLAAAALVLDALRTGALRAPLDPARAAGPLADFAARVPGWWFGLLGPPALALALNAARVKNCDPKLGLAFWVAIPAVSVVVGAALAFGAAAVARSTAARAALVLAVVVADAAFLAWRLAWWPPIHGHTLLAGWFAGSLYDEALSLPGHLWWWRALVLSAVAVGLLALEAAWRVRGRRPLGPVPGLVLLCAAALAVQARDARRHGLFLDSDTVQRRLGAVVETPHFRIHYDPGQLGAEAVRELAADAEFRYAELGAYLGTDPVAWAGRPIGAYIYPDAESQQKLMGARRTYVARPWTHEMHLRWEGEGDTGLAHELAHLFTAPFGGGPLRLATWGGVLINLGLVEGIALAADWPAEPLDAHGSSAALRRAGVAPDLRHLFDPAGFWTQPAGKAYTMMGSFVRWLVDTHGIARFQSVYRDGDFDAAYGRSVEALIAEWEGFLDAQPLSSDAVAWAVARYDRPSIWEKTCARTVAELNRKAQAAEGRQDWKTALQLRQRLRELQPKNAGQIYEIALLTARAGDRPAALALLAELGARPSLDAPLRAKVRESEADLRWEGGERAAARAAYEDCQAEAFADDTWRRLLAKAHGAGLADDGAAEQARRYLVGEAPPALDQHLLRDWAEALPEDPLPRYLIGLNLARLGDSAGVVRWLGPVQLTAPALEEQRRLLLARALRRSGDLGGAAAALGGLEASASVEKRLQAEEERARIAWVAAGGAAALAGLAPRAP